MQYLPLLWRVRLSGAAVEYNDVIVNLSLLSKQDIRHTPISHISLLLRFLIAKKGLLDSSYYSLSNKREALLINFSLSEIQVSKQILFQCDCRKYLAPLCSTAGVPCGSQRPRSRRKLSFFALLFLFTTVEPFPARACSLV